MEGDFTEKRRDKMHDDFIEKRMAIEANGSRIPAVLTMPAGRPAAWGVVIVPGSFWNDVDGDYLAGNGNPFQIRPHMYKDLAEGLAANGVAALRYARAGEAVIDAAEAAAHRRFSDRATVVRKAAEALRRTAPGIGRLALAGHSEGGPVSLDFLSREGTAGIDAYISLSAPARKMFDIMLQQAEAATVDGLMRFGPMSSRFDDYRTALELVRSGNPIPPDLIKKLPPFGVHAMDEAGKAYLRDYDLVDSMALIAGLSLPVLLVQGGLDDSVFPDNAELLAEARKGNRAPTGRAFFPRLQHFYKEVPPGMDPRAVFGMDMRSDPGVAKAIARWLANIV